MIMPASITHKKTNSIADWTQTQLNEVVSGGAPPALPSGTVLDDIVLPTDWNDEHNVSLQVAPSEIILSGTNKVIGGGAGAATELGLTDGIVINSGNLILSNITPDSINTGEGSFTRVVVGNDSYDSPFIVDIQSGTDPYRAVFSNFITGTAGGARQADIAILSGLVPSESVAIMASVYNSTSFTLQGGADATSAFGAYSTLSFSAQSGSTYTKAGGIYLNNAIVLTTGSSVSDFYGVLIDEGIFSGAGTISRAWGAYIKQPAFGTSKKAVYTDNLTVGDDTLNPGGSGAAFASLTTGGLVQSSAGGIISNGNLSGDVTTSNTLAATLATVNGSPGSYGSASDTLTATVNGKGLVTALTATAIAINSGAVTDFGEAVDDRAAALIQNGTGISWSYNDGAGTLTPTVSLSPFTTSNLSEGSNLYYTDSRVRAATLSGLSVAGGSISASDNVLAAFGKLQNQINGVLGGAIYQGIWNASTNSPSLSSGVGTKGYYYVVSVAGSTNLDGITDWKVGDWAIFNGTAWDKVDNTDAVSSVNGAIGAVSLAGTSGRITVIGTNWDIAATYVGQTSITTLGTVATGTWQGSIVSPAYGGTGYNNGTHKIYLANGAAGKVLMYDPLANEASYQALGGIVVTDAKGTADQVLVNGFAGVFYQGGVTLSLPQSIGTASSVQFGRLRVDGNTGNISGSNVYINKISPVLDGVIGVSTTLNVLEIVPTLSGASGSGSLVNLVKMGGVDFTAAPFNTAFTLSVEKCIGASSVNGAIHADNIAIGSQVTPPTNGAYVHGNAHVNGSIGAGVAPGYKLHIQGSSGTPQVQLGTASNGLQLNVFDADNTYLVGTSSSTQRLNVGTQNNGDLAFMTHNTGRAVLTNDGFFAVGRSDDSDARMEIVGGFTSGTASANSQTLKVRAGTLQNTTGSDLNLATFQFSTSNQMALGVHARRMDGGGAGDWTSAAIGLGVDVDASPFSGKANVWFHQGGLALGVGTSALSNSYLQASQVNIWVDEGSNLLTFKVKYSDGTTIKSGTVALS